jgi:hypothetical protein
MFLGAIKESQASPVLLISLVIMLHGLTAAAYIEAQVSSRSGPYC